MPVYGPGEWLHPGTRPPGCAVSGAGRFVLRPGDRFDRHFHDDDEIWFISEGAGVMLLEGELRPVRAGDVVLVPAGTDHDVLTVTEHLSGFFVETGHFPTEATPGGRRVGHLHRTAADAAGHVVAGE